MIILSCKQFLKRVSTQDEKYSEIQDLFWFASIIYGSVIS